MVKFLPLLASLGYSFCTLRMTRSNIILVGIAVVLIMFILGAVALFDTGYRLKGFRILRPATIVFASFPSDAVVRVDGKEFLLTAEPDETFSFRTSAENHDIIVTRVNYWPWEKEVFPAGGATLILYPFLLPRETKATILLKGDAKRKGVTAALSRLRVPTAASPLFAHDGSVSLFVRDSELIARAPDDRAPPSYFCREQICREEQTILSFEAEMRNVAFLPGRADVALLAIQNGIFALELDARGIQNFQPVYKGVRPRLAVIETVLYVEDGESVFAVSLE